MIKPGFIRINLFLLILSLSTLLLFSGGCGEKGEEETIGIEEIGSEYIPPHAQDASNTPLKDLFSDSSQKSATKTSTMGEEGWIIKNINRIEEIIINREVSPDELERGVQLTYEIINSLPTANTHKCYIGSGRKSLNPRGLCNKYARLFSKISELRYFQGDVLSLDDLKTRIYYFDLGKKSGSTSLEYNQNLVDGLFWAATNLGSWVSSMHQQYKYNIFKLIENNRALTKTPALVEAMLHRARRIYSIYRGGAIYMALGRLYHKVPEKYLEIESGPLPAEKYLRRVNKIRKDKHHLPHYYLFMFYKDNDNVDGALREAKWLLGNLKKVDFVKQFPIYAQREYDSVMEFMNR
ncbi:MAG: hypothetical protein A3F16_06890 [Deltaproteobacteria bacterium RIFCSPHIGHO2_12_FULL_43_9]|nr:MAG: hypothetical protein A3F16_06890 [Deltaproteobacteria bacterium RIFCSPHIGHO2_12_FULL_43_9]